MYKPGAEAPGNASFQRSREAATQPGLSVMRSLEQIALVNEMLCRSKSSRNSSSNVPASMMPGLIADVLANSLRLRVADCECTVNRFASEKSRFCILS